MSASQPRPTRSPSGSSRHQLLSCVGDRSEEGSDHLEPVSVRLHTDSAYLVNCFRERWHERWARNGWQNSKKQPVENRDLWERLLVLTRRHAVDFIKVKGHSTTGGTIGATSWPSLRPRHFGKAPRHGSPQPDSFIRVRLCARSETTRPRVSPSRFGVGRQRTVAPRDLAATRKVMGFPRVRRRAPTRASAPPGDPGTRPRRSGRFRGAGKKMRETITATLGVAVSG